jgi:hypothetical protein
MRSARQGRDFISIPSDENAVCPAVIPGSGGFVIEPNIPREH